MYDPKAFDEIRENYGLGKDEKKNRLWERIAKGIILFAWGFFLSIAIGATIAMHYASALETLGSVDYNRAKTWWDNLSSRSVSGNYWADGTYWQSNITEWLTVYGELEWSHSYENPYSRVDIGNWTNVVLSWRGNNSWWNCGGVCFFGSYSFARMSVNRIQIGDYSDLEVLIQTKHLQGDAIINHRWRVIAKNDGSVAWLANFGDFYTIRNGMLLHISKNGSNFVYRRMNNYGTWTDIGTLWTPLNYVLPAVPARCVETNAYTGNVEPVCFYRWMDGNPYAVFLFWTVTALWRMDTGEMSGGGWQNYLCEWLPGCSGSEQPAIEFLAGMRPFWLIEPNNDNILSVWNKWPNVPQYGGVVTANISISGFYESETQWFLGISGFVNPKMYLLRNDGTIWIHDISCVQPGFETCGPYNGGYACQASNWATPISPMPVLACNAPLEIPPYYYDPNYSGSGTTGWTGTTGGNCSGSWCISQWTGSGAISGLQGFIDYVTDCDTDDNWEVTIWEWLLCIPESIGRFFGGIFDRLADVWGKTWTLIEATIKMATPTGSGAVNPFSFDFIETAHAETGAINPMVQALAGQVDWLKNNTNPLWKFVDYLYWGIIFVMIIAGILIFAKARK